MRVRVLSVLCVGNHGERRYFHDNENGGWVTLPYETTMEDVRLDSESSECDTCTREGIPRPHLRFATEPIDD